MKKGQLGAKVVTGHIACLRISQRLSLPSLIHVPPIALSLSLMGPQRSPRNFFGLTNVASSPSSMFSKLMSIPASLSLSAIPVDAWMGSSSAIIRVCPSALPTERMIPILEPQSGQVSHMMFDPSLLKEDTLASTWRDCVKSATVRLRTVIPCLEHIGRFFGP